MLWYLISPAGVPPTEATTTGVGASLGLVVGGLLGGIVGFMQQRLTRNAIPHHRGWILTSITLWLPFGGLVGALAWVLVGTHQSPLALLLVSVVQALALGIIQFIGFSTHRRDTEWWLFAAIVTGIISVTWTRTAFHNPYTWSVGAAFANSLVITLLVWRMTATPFRD
jgi:hypothetical protein